MKRELNKEQFFTKPENVKKCLSLADLDEYDVIIEPSAGDGAFSKLIEGCLAMDIEPMGENIKKQDFLTFSFYKENKKVLTIGNPPYGRQSSLAVKFINKAAEFSDKIIFILPLSFKKESMISRLNKHIFLERVEDLITNDFYFQDKNFTIPCAIFIFKIDKNSTRAKPKKYTTNDFSFVSKELADDSIRRVGFYSGKLEGLNVSESSHYFIKWNNPSAKEIFKKINFTDSASNTVGARSISKNEIIKLYLEEINGKAD